MTPSEAGVAMSERKILKEWPKSPGLYWFFGYLHKGDEEIPRHYIVHVFNDIHAQIFQSGQYLDREQIGGVWLQIEIPDLRPAYEGASR